MLEALRLSEIELNERKSSIKISSILDYLSYSTEKVSNRKDYLNFSLMFFDMFYLLLSKEMLSMRLN
jgi:hypothetical protein